MVASPAHGSFGNAEDVWFGGGDDRDAEARAEQSVAAVGARIVGAKPFPVAARRLEELTRNPKARLEQVVSVLETDPGLSVRLLRLVNSAGYGLKVRVTSVRHAAVLVGTRRLHQVATTAAILDLFEANNETAVELLEHATVVGSLCRYLAVHLGLPHDELFTCGFLHDIGKLMLLDTEGDKYADLVRNYGGAPDQLHIHERRVFGFDHALLGAHVLKAWNIPDPVPKVVLYHHAPARALQDTLLSSMVHTLRLADMMSYALVLESDQEGIAIVTESEAAQYLEISEPQVAAMWSDLRALAERSRARSHGQPDMEVVAPRRLEVPRSLRPRRSGAPRSLPPSPSMPADRDSSRSVSAPRSSSEVNEVPAHFPCVACSKPSYGNICAACEGQVCPEHQLGPDHWCVLCLAEHARFRSKNVLPGYLKVTGLAIAGFSVGASVTGVMVSQTFAVWKLIVAPLTMVLLWGVLLPVLHRWWQRRRFLNTRTKGRQPLPIQLPRPNPVFISSLDANLQSDGMMGPSIPPPSQSGISIIAPRPAVAASEPNQPSAQAIAAEAKASAALLQQHVPTESSMVVAAVVETTPTPVVGAYSQPASAGLSVDPSEEPMPPSEKELDDAARALERSSEVMPRAPSVHPGAISPLLGAAASLNPPSAPPPALLTAQAAPTASSSPQTAKAKDSVAAHIASLLGETSEGLSEFPSIGSESELESVVASVSARLAREFPQNDYMGPSAELRAATIAPIAEKPEPAVEAKPESVVEAAVEAKPEPAVEAAVEAKPEPVVETAVEAKPEPAVEAAVEAKPEAVVEGAVEAKPEPVVEAAVEAKPESVVEAAVEAKPEPAVEAKPESVVEAVVEAKPEPVVEAKPEPVVEAKPEPVVEAKPEPVEAKPEPVVEAKPEPVVKAKPEPEAEPISEAAPSSSQRPPPASIRLVFPRKNWEQGCAPRRVFRCALPVAESCSPAPRRLSVRPGPTDYAVGDTVPPGTLRGLG